MKPIERGVLDESCIYFPTPSNWSKKKFYYPVALGEFYCNKHYHVQRSSYPSVLLMVVLSGSIQVRYGGNTHIAEPGHVVFLNCYEPHEYAADTNATILWVHFDGAQSLELYESIYRARGIVFKPEGMGEIKQTLEKLFTLYETQDLVSAPKVSLAIYALLCNLLDTTLNDNTAQGNEVVDLALAYIRANIAHNIKVKNIADHCAISPSHFSRIFKEKIGYSPYEYLIKLRIEKAKTMLKTHDMPVAEVAVATGFQDTCSFIVAFKSRVNLTPGEFRKLSF